MRHRDGGDHPVNIPPEDAEGGGRTVARRVWSRLFPSIPAEEGAALMKLSSILCCIMCAYWLLRTQKDALFMKITGRRFIPYAKMLTCALMVPMNIVYSLLVDLVERHRLFYIIGISYGVTFALATAALHVPSTGLANPEAGPTRLLGWVIYIAVESFGSLAVALFWSFTNSITDTNRAKAGYGLIVWGAQFGSIGGPTLSRAFARRLGPPQLLLLGSLLVLLVPVLVWRFVAAHRPPAPTEQRRPSGMLEGVRLLVSNPYLMGILGIATFGEVIGTILDYQMKAQLDVKFRSAGEVAEFMGAFGQWTNGVTFAFSLLGTGFFLQHLGVTWCLVAFPVGLAGASVVLWLYPGLMTVFYCLVALRGLTYALNNPCKEILYIPTSKDAQYKTKGWIDVFGARAAKSLGSVVNAGFPTMAALRGWTPPLGFALAAVWFVVAVYTGQAHGALRRADKRMVSRTLL